MPSIDEEIKELEGEIKKTQYNKATEHHIGRIKAKIAKLEKIKEERSKKGGGTGFFIKKGIYPSIGLLGPPSVGKSSILNAITNAESRVGEFDFTTLSIVPGVMEYRNMKFRILDLPGVIEGAHEGKGRGREVIAVLRNVDLIAIVLDPFKYDPSYILKELKREGIRVNQKPPKMSIILKDRGGLNITKVGKSEFDLELLESISREFGIINADIILRQSMTPEIFIDGLLGNRVYIPAIFILNKSDTPEFAKGFEFLQSLGLDPIPLSIVKKKNIELLKEKIAGKVRMIRVHLIPSNASADEEPMVIREGSTVEDVCKAVHTEFVEKFKFATITGRSVRFPNQRVGLEHRVQDGDMLTVFLKKG
ncbi:MAG: 50S ribosome-binding GTPase [Thermoplasmatales archaeon]|nr:50S ribosome-binding GTPase [Candidatus Thermoplasmatota archaeon]MCL6002580.1 50S ribosome-binding GTPase [Candidatus Thermoplasmatota archaeon]MDA8055637.1 50S ribosome-binding GTPase [Thermoplasmatales archaeon]